MNRFAALRWLTWDTFRQARASGLQTVLLVLSATTVLVCLTAEPHGDVHLRSPDGDKLEMLPPTDKEAKLAATKGGPVLLRNRLTLLGGKLEIPLARDIADGVRWLHYILATRVAETAGVLLALIWTAGFAPAFLQPNAVVVLLAKPPSRTTLLFGKSMGVLLFVALHACLFVVGTWAALGVRTGVWETPYLYSLPLLLVQFAAFYGFSLMLATMFRSAVVCVLGSLLCWTICLGVNSGRHALVAGPYLFEEEAKAKLVQAETINRKALENAEPRDLDPFAIPPADPSLKPRTPKQAPQKPTKPEQLRPSERIDPAAPAPELGAPQGLVGVVDVAYWLLPKPLDFSYVVYDNVRAAGLVEAPPYYDAIVGRKLLDLRWSVLSSLAFAVVMFVAAAQQFHQDDY